MSKFGGSELAEKLYGDSLESFQDDELGSVNDIGWHALFKYDKAILIEDDQGFVYIITYDSLDKLMSDWHTLQEGYSQYLAATENIG